MVAGPGMYCRVIPGDPAEAWLAWEDAMSKYQAHMDHEVRVLMDCWDRFLFERKPDLDAART